MTTTVAMIFAGEGRTLLIVIAITFPILPLSIQTGAVFVLLLSPFFDDGHQPPLSGRVPIIASTACVYVCLVVPDFAGLSLCNVHQSSLCPPSQFNPFSS